ncbi:hypothetical protein [Mesorhizobium sp. M1322]|uniref:hypothetical protein n=1 Tax=Mesorhizobium sp. M1322 TaxID=2957081 RepID=UPI0033377E66
MGLQPFCLTMIFFKTGFHFLDLMVRRRKSRACLVPAGRGFVDRTMPGRSRARKPLAFPVRRAAWLYPARRVLVIVGSTVLRGLVLAGPAILRGLDLKRPCR